MRPKGMLCIFFFFWFFRDGGSGAPLDDPYHTIGG